MKTILFTEYVCGARETRKGDMRCNIVLVTSLWAAMTEGALMPSDKEKGRRGRAAGVLNHINTFDVILSSQCGVCGRGKDYRRGKTTSKFCVELGSVGYS